MNKIDDNIIKETLNNQYKYLKSIFDEERILGLFVYGACNHGFANTTDEIETVMCYLPTFEEVCLEKPQPNYFIEYDNKKIKIADIRCVLELALKQDIETTEAVFTKYRILNPRYENIFCNEIYLNREIIFRSEPRTRIDVAVEAIHRNLEEYKSTKNVKALFAACRKKIATQQFLDGASIENCINIKDEFIVKYLWSIKNQEYTPRLEEIEFDIHNIEQRAILLKNTGASRRIIKQAIFELLRIAILKDIQGDDFLSTLTKTEENAWNETKKYLEKGEACISFSQLIDDTGISRPVFKSMCQKLKDSNVADVVNQGVKGTYIKVIDYSIMK